MLRYEADTQYKTVTGGIFTLIIIIIVAVGFTSMISSTLNKTAIDASISETKSNDPTYL